jgi:hypothetical protein
VAVGAVYDFGSEEVNLRSPRSYFHPLKTCIEEHPFLTVVVKAQETEKPFYERVGLVHLENHVLVGHDLVISDSASAAETRAIETVLNPAVDKSWLSERPPWRIFVYPIITPSVTRPSKCFIIFSFSHALSDGMAGPAFHRTFMKSMGLADQILDAPRIVIPAQPLPAAFDTAERLPISWGFLLAPLIAVLLPKSLCSFLGIRAAASTVDEGTWLGPPMFFDHNDFETQIKLLEVEGPVLQNALQVCRKNSARLTGVLHQVIVRALSKAVSASEVTNFCTTTSVNMRKSVGTPDSEMGMYVTACYEQHSRDEKLGPLSEDSWKAARATTKKLAEKAVDLQDQPIGLLRFAPSIRSYLTGKLGQQRDSSYEISNLIAFSNAVDSANCKITKMIFASPSGVVSPPLVFNVVSVSGGSLVIAITWQRGAIGIRKDDERSFVDDVCETILTDLKALS